MLFTRGAVMRWARISERPGLFSTWHHYPEQVHSVLGFCTSDLFRRHCDRRIQLLDETTENPQLRPRDQVCAICAEHVLQTHQTIIRESTA